MANLSSSCVMVSCPGALPLLGSNLTMLMSSFGTTSATSWWLSSLSWIPSLFDSNGVNMYRLASTNWFIEIVTLDPKVCYKLCQAYTFSLVQFQARLKA